MATPQVSDGLSISIETSHLGNDDQSQRSDRGFRLAETGQYNQSQAIATLQLCRHQTIDVGIKSLLHNG